MTLTPSLPTTSMAGLPLLAERRIWAGAVARAADGTPRTGVFPAHFGPLVTGTASMGYRIAEFVAVTSRSLPGVDFVANDGIANLSPAGYAAPTANSRLDVIWVRSRFPELGDASDSPEFGITKGAASPTPVKPPPPPGALELAVAEVKATDTTTQTVVITQTHRYTAMVGGTVLLRSAAEQSAWSPADGAPAFRVDTATALRRIDGVWVPEAGKGVPHFVFRRSEAYLFETGAAVPLTWDSTPYEGALAGFSTTNQREFVCTVPGVYDVSTAISPVGGLATPSPAPSTYVNVYLRKNGDIVAAGNGVTAGNAFTSPSVTPKALVRFAVGDVLTVAIGAGVAVSGATGPNCVLFVDYLHA